jgi:hypothetical protein
MHIKRGVYLRAAEKFRLKSYSRVRQITLASLSCLLLIVGVLVIFKDAFATPPCPCSVFSLQSPTTEPGLYNEAGGIEVGFKFTVERSGYITGVRFYKVAGMSGVHTASLWDSLGNRLATATFSSETAAGWQEISFAPIAVVANRPYIASVFMADGHYVATPAYFTSVLTNTPFVVPRDGDAWDGAGHQGQGVFDTSGASAYPIGSFNANNYWVDTVYVSTPGAAAPLVTSQYPGADATAVTVSDAVTATFDKRLDPATVTTNTFIVKNAQGEVVPGSVGYDQDTSLATFIPDTLLQTQATYTATLRGGLGQVMTDYEGHELGVDYTWSFTTSDTPVTCPCSLKQKQAPTTATSYRELYPNGLELGLKVAPTTKGYLRAIRFYKPLIQDQTSHVGHVWDSNGNMLATVTFNNESAYGWQEAALPTPISVVKDHAYIVSFGLTTSTNYIATINGLDSPLTSPGLVAYPSGNWRNAALGSGTANSVYAMTAGTYPSSPASNNQDYMIDAVFSLQAHEIEPLRLIQTQPSRDSYGIKADTAVSATFDQALDQASISASTVSVRNAASVDIPGQVSYDTARHAIVFRPATNLTAQERYTAMITTGVKDVRGESLPHTYEWSFVVGSTVAADMNQGKGGPVLVVTSDDDAYGAYYAEILRTEGITYFDVQGLSAIDANTLRNYKAVVLSQTALTSTQVATLQSWVTSGGNLVAMRPDKKLADLLGIEDAGGSLTNAYMKVDTATAPGLGIVSETMQYKGSADRYTVHDATLVGRLYSSATTETAYPAVTTRSVGAGTAMSFSYDLARSVIGLHQGNQAWAGQDRNGDGALRTPDLFYGAAPVDMQPDWLDTNKMDIPQADEQQRVLINLLTDAMKKSLPSPRFWYLPHNLKTALVYAGDDHGLANDQGTEQQLDHLLNVSDVDCSVMDWQCARASHYVYANAALTNARAAQFVEYGFDVGSHPAAAGGSCDMPASYALLNQAYATNLSTFRTKYASLPFQRTARFHCYAWPSWDWMPRADSANGVRYDLNAVAYPSSWIGSHSPMVTGSGMNMRLTDASGALLDVRQGVTNFDNVSSSATSVAAMFDNALGVKGYYGIFGSHYDMSDGYEKTLYTLAASRHIPIITADQALTWLDGRGASAFTDLKSEELGRVTFSIEAAEGAYGLQAMMPLRDADGDLVTITLAGQLVDYHTEIIKGVNYAIFAAKPGAYEITYSDFGVEAAGKGSITPTPVPPRRATTTASLIDEQVSASSAEAQLPSSVQASTGEQPALRADSVHSPDTTIEVWWQRPLVLVAFGGGLVLTSGGLWWLLALRRR